MAFLLLSSEKPESQSCSRKNSVVSTHVLKLSHVSKLHRRQPVLRKTTSRPLGRLLKCLRISIPKHRHYSRPNTGASETQTALGGEVLILGVFPVGFKELGSDM